MNPMVALRRNWLVYVGNASATRDFRVQLRGGRSVFLFAVYLSVLIVAAMFVYDQTASQADIGLAAAQSQLRGFYTTIMTLLGSMVCLVAPGLSATTVVIERQRQSLDLVFSAPVSAKYYLVGKMISSFRYTWMLLVLALPVTATCVLLGGAAWSDVLVSYLLLSMSALVLTSIALMLSTVAPKPVSAIVWSYFATFLYLIVVTPIALALSFGTSSRETPFLVAMSPFSVSQATDTYSTIFNVQVPNWILAALVSLLIVKICVLAGGAVLSPPRSKDVSLLRIHCLVYLCAASFGGVFLVPVATSGGVPPGSILGPALFFLLTPLIVFLPALTCSGLDGERRYQPNGGPRLSRIFDGTPAGALPFIWALVIGSALSIQIAWWVHGGRISLWPEFGGYVAYTLGFWTMFWAAGRFFSSLLIGLKIARIMQFSAVLCITVIPYPLISALTLSNSSSEMSSRAAWKLYILDPIIDSSYNHVSPLLVGSLMLCVGIGLGMYSEARLIRKLKEVPANSDGKSLATA